MPSWQVPGSALAQGKVLKFVQNGNLTILDPIWTTAYVTRNHGYLIYDTLFASDESNAVKPQMVDKYEVSPDKTVWTFTLRDGLEWHDGKPVTSEDCIASHPALGQARRDGHQAHGLREGVQGGRRQDLPDGPEGALRPGARLRSASPSSNVPFMMPKAVAETDAFKQIDSQIGSGPFIYQKDQSKPGEKHVYLKNPKYKPRCEPASGLAGGKVVKVDRVEIIEMPDSQQQVNALIAGEIDLVEQPPHDLLPVLKAEKIRRSSSRLEPARPGLRHPLQLAVVKPFDNPKIRLAALHSMRQEDYLKATVGESELLQGLPGRLHLRHAQRLGQDPRAC